ncbi:MULTISPECIES: NAD(P)-dependent oxidoreductase [unclassified Cyanobium]|uniref:NAD-dependent epimerase/dehydratase family protein n=1 Tax=unclassified Cyanobium TaxID=2627006 RepID=UPI0020CEF480|nr:MULTISPECIES: NAD(P)-dependent oxidoreductase [unclassified Cyanobium]MCP9860385.1 NAD(P)-dependent oxidoreductase [Cyanobium sp. Cruz-8H5]MCP9867695.1 NAD(P)-dependent oxidoreductase [Cyanobium sp. Cruz-8D1]
MNLLITGGTGFFGRALIKYLEAERLSTGALPFEQITVLSRSPEKFSLSYSALANLAWIRWHAGDVLNPDSLPQQNFSHILHAAADSTDAAALTPLQRYQQIALGTQNILDFAVQHRTQRFLLTSSGGVYGPQPDGMAFIPETYNGMPDPLLLSSTYGIAKRQAEHLCTLYGEQYGIETVIARCFAFVGEDLPLHAHFAIGNFIRDALWHEAITVGGDGTPLRSYLDQLDLAHWLICLLLQGQPGQAYNVGSDVAISVADLAFLVRDTLAPRKSVHILRVPDQQRQRNRYIPSIEKARTDLQLDVRIALQQAITHTAEIRSREQERLNGS